MCLDERPVPPGVGSPQTGLPTLARASKHFPMLNFRRETEPESAAETGKQAGPAASRVKLEDRGAFSSPSLDQAGAFYVGRDGIETGACGDVESVVVLSAEAHVGGRFRHRNETDLLAGFSADHGDARGPAEGT